MNDALRLQAIQQGQRDIIDATTASEQRLTANQTNLLTNQAANAQAQQACCADIKYNSALNTAAINQNVTASSQKVLDAIQQDKIERLNGRISQQNAVISQLQQNAYVRDQLAPMQQQMFMTVKYPNPNAYSYSAGPNPYCGCNCSTTV